MSLSKSTEKVKLLCLCGAFNNSSVFQLQIAPIVEELKTEAIFHFTQGTILSKPPADVDTFFGPPPNYCWLPNPVLIELRDVPEQEYPEDTMRLLSRSTVQDTAASARYALDHIYETMEKAGPFDGVLGYSEGAGMGATLLVEEARRQKEEGKEPTLKFGIFFGGWPPMDTNLSGPGERESFLLSDVVGQIVKVPTLHLLGSQDAYVFGSMSLYNVCDSETAQIYDHGKRHFLPRDPVLVKEIAEAIRSMFRKPHEVG